MRSSKVAFLLSATSIVQAAPQLFSRTETPLSASQLADLAPYTQFARAAYCPTSDLYKWNCGQACSALPGFQPTLVGGIGNAFQTFFVGYWPDRHSVVVVHEGTDPRKFLSVLTDANIGLVPLDNTLFPGVSPAALVHRGFRNEQARNAPLILAEVQRLFSQCDTKTLILVGHSLGGAISELDSLFFALNIPGVSIRTVTYGTPRVGNRDFVQLIDSQVANFSRVNNKRDIIPILPGRFLGFQHPAGEIHILFPGYAIACSGDDDSTDPHCTDGTVPNIFRGDIANHLGPYEGIYIGTIFCI
ncbi:hypothetical protein AX15_006820 [Amanita polypyramis BW_CC]|nr:hypothetical protein AX15_006820 [Amanita polypyramis BW_CC]